MQIASNVLFTIHFGLLGAWSGFALNGAAVIRTVMMFARSCGKRWAGKPLALVFMLSVCVVAGLATYDGLKTLLIVVAMIASTLGLWVGSSNAIRYSMFVASPMWLIYNSIVGSISGIVTETFNLISIAIFFIRMAFERKHKNSKEEVKEK